ncbi:hypothetical protein FRB90_012387 [Tulasnella sp. 427]|nr:hypothetical protein FRB90_012387 [Tulasnella sp. 427]
MNQPASSSGASYKEPTTDPGYNLRLKRTAKAQECFDKFQPYVNWLRAWINANGALLANSKDLVDQFEYIWQTWSAGQTEAEKISVFEELFQQKAHSQVRELYEMYKNLRKELEDRATENVTEKAAAAASKIAAAEIAQGKRFVNDPSSEERALK